jgi:isochorismate hydrolase
MVEIGGKQIPTTLVELVDPKRAALLIWDMGNAIGPNAFNY